MAGENFVPGSESWCGRYCPEHAMIKDNLQDAKGKVSMTIFTVAIGIVVLVFGAVFTIQSTTSSNVASIDKNTALIQQAQERVVGTLDRIQARVDARLEAQAEKLEAHKDRVGLHK